jgi:hypothetical protein
VQAAALMYEPLEFDLMEEHLKELLERIDALEQLLVVYRVGSRPTEKLFKILEKTSVNEKKIRNEYI